MTTSDNTKTLRPGVMRGLRGKVLLACVSLSIVIAVLAVVGEAAARYREWHRSTVPGTMPLLYYRHRMLGLALVRDYDYFGWVHINKFGFRGADITLKPLEGVTRIMVVGGSTTFDSFVTQDDMAWPARLEYWLARLHPADSVEVINAGTPGYNVFQNTLRLESELHRYQPDMIILYHTHNDLFRALRRAVLQPEGFTATPGRVPTVTPWGDWLASHSLLYTKLVGRWKAITFQSTGRKALESTTRPPPEKVLADGAVRFARDVSLFLSVAATYRIPVLISDVVHVTGTDSALARDPLINAMWQHTVPFETPATVLRGYREFSNQLAAVADHHGLPFITTAGFGLSGTEWYALGDPIHFTDAGADRMGRAMAGALLDSGVLFDSQ